MQAHFCWDLRLGIGLGGSPIPFFCDDHTTTPNTTIAHAPDDRKRCGCGNHYTLHLGINIHRIRNRNRNLHSSGMIHGWMQTSRMPSTHSSAVAFMATYIILACSRLPLPASLSWLSADEEGLVRQIGPVAAVGWAGLVTASRLYLGHHTVPQVAAGIGFGVMFGLGCFSLWTVYGLDGYGALLEREAIALWVSSRR